MAGPVILATQRWVDAHADRYGLALANEPDGAARALLRTVDFRTSSPGPMEEALFDDHLSVARRVARAMEWKAAHPPNAE